jgi:translin
MDGWTALLARATAERQLAAEGRWEELAESTAERVRMAGGGGAPPPPGRGGGRGGAGARAGPARRPPPARPPAPPRPAGRARRRAPRGVCRRAGPRRLSAAMPHVGDLTALQTAIDDRLAAKHRAREAALGAARQATRSAANAIRAAHREDRNAAAGLLAEARRHLDDALDASRGHPDVQHAGFVHDAMKEYAEAGTTLALITGAPLPEPDQLGVTDAAWLNGLAETVGELRRHLLDGLRTGRLARCEELLAAMDDIFALLVALDYPEGVTAGLRRSTDMARGILERTRGDLTSALVQARLHKALEDHRRTLG